MIGKQPARIITFYSYKGGTGRSMALANWAWILAFQGKRVLCIDWDVEAPGLHRYFRPFLIDKDLRASTGVIDFAVHFATESLKPSDDSLPPEWYFEHADISEHAIALDWNFPGGGRIDFVPAGRQDANYATLVSTFSWQNFYENLGGGALIDAMRKLLREKGEYDVVLIDSRTGVSDTAGICTVQLPDTLICCFTYNNQSTDGASAIAASAQQLRRQPEYARGGLEDLVVYPIPMRVDPFEEDRLRERQAYAWNVFEPILPATVNVPREYWLGVEVPYKPALSYEEQLAVFRDESSDPKSALTAFLRACGYVFGPEAASLPSLLSPEERQQVIADFARTAGGVDRVAASAESTAEAAARRAETIYQRLSPEDQVLARRLWLALIRTTESYESSNALSSFRIRMSDVGVAYADVAWSFVEGGALKTETDGDESYLSIASPSILFGWKRLVEWTDLESGFLSWRQRLRASIEEARGRNGRLRGTKLKDAQWWLKRRRDDLLPFEIAFIERSQRVLNYGRAGLAAAALIIVVIAIITYARRNQPHQTALEAEKIVVKALSVDDPLQTALLLAEVKREPENAKQYLDRVRAKLAQPLPRAVLRGHTDVVRTVDFSPDDTMLVTAGDDDHAIIWGTAAGELRVSSVIGESVKPLEEKRSIPAARFLDSDSIVVLGFTDNVRLLDLTGTPYKRLETDVLGLRLGGVDPINKKIVFYTGGMVAIGNWKDDIISPSDFFPSLRAVVTTPGLVACLGKTGLSFLTIDGKSTGVHRTTFGATTAMAFADKTLYAEADGVVWRVVPDSPDSDHMFATPLSNVTTMAMIGGTHVALGNEDGTVIVCDLDGHNARKFIGHRGAIRDIRISHNGQLMATASATARIWSLGPVPAVPKTFTEIAKSIAGRTTACLTSAERSLLLGEPATDAQTKATACEQQHGRASVAHASNDFQN